MKAKMEKTESLRWEGILKRTIGTLFDWGRRIPFHDHMAKIHNHSNQIELLAISNGNLTVKRFAAYVLVCT